MRVRVDPAGGHGVGATSDQFFAETADVYSFLLVAFGDPGVIGANGWRRARRHSGGALTAEMVEALGSFSA